MVRDVEVENAPPLVGPDEEAKQHLESGGRTVKKSIETSSPMWLSRKLRQVCEGGFRVVGM